MPSLASFPVELVTRVVSLTVSRQDLAALRLTSRALEEIATPFYFSTVALYPEWDEDGAPDPPFPNQIKYKAQYLANILDDERLKTLIKKIEIYTCNPDCDHHPCWVHHAGDLHMYDGFMPRPEMSDGWMQVYNRIPEFPKLDSVSLVFDRHAGDVEMWGNAEELQGPDERIAWVRKLLRLLGNRIRNLSIRHMQLYKWITYEFDAQETKDDLANDLALKDVILAGLEAFRMNVVQIQPPGESGPVYKVTDCHSEWATFPSTWLVPAANLRHLTLYSDVPVGWFPKLDLRCVHFARLETLALGQFIFSNELPFEWITSHSETLRELYLDHCSILYQYGAGRHRDEWLDDEGYPITDPTPGYSFLGDCPDDNIVSFGSYSKRWHEVFNHFSSALGRLCTFRFGTSARWKFDVVNRYDDASPGMPVVPWEVERDLLSGIFSERYLIWDDFNSEYFTRWADQGEEKVKHSKYWDERDLERFEEYPECTADDMSALHEFVKKIGMPNVDAIGVADMKTKYLY